MSLQEDLDQLIEVRLDVESAYKEAYAFLDNLYRFRIAMENEKGKFTEVDKDEKLKMSQSLEAFAMSLAMLREKNKKGRKDLEEMNAELTNILGQL